MAKIQFDIKYKPQIESGEYKVETNLTEPVTIIKWDLKNDDGNILCCYFDGREEVPYVTEGKDLFIVTPEEELSEFEKGCIRLYQDGRDDGFAGDNLSDEILKESAAELLELAKKEIAKRHEHDVYIPEDTYYEQLKKQWEEGYDKGKSEALKDLPRWEKYPYNAGGKPLVNGILQKDGSHKWRLYLNGYKIEISELEKLPGFNE